MIIENLVSSTPSTIGASRSSFVDDDGVSWWVITPSTSVSYIGGMRLSVPLDRLEQGQPYIAGAYLHNPSTTARRFRVNWCDQGTKPVTVGAGETIALLTDPTIADYSTTYRFVDIRPYDTGDTHEPFWLRQITVVKAPWDNPVPFDGDVCPAGMISWWADQPGSSASFMSTPPPQIGGGSMSNRWPDPNYEISGAPWTSVPGVGYELKTTATQQGSYAFGTIAVEPGATLYGGFRVGTIAGTGRPRVAITAQFPGTTGISAAVVKYYAPDDSGFVNFTYQVPSNSTITAMALGLYTYAPFVSGSTIRISDIVVAGGVASSSRAHDQVTLATLPAPSYVRTYYLLQSSTLNPPAKPTTNPPAAPWTTTEPTYTEGSTNTLYTVMLTAYGSVAFEYGDVQKSSSYEAAKAAYNKALAAVDAASGALTVANGKISLGGLGVANPPTTGHSEGDLILTRNAAGKVDGVKIMDASKKWVAYTLLADQVLVPGSTGTISLADDAVTAPKIFADEALLKKLLVRKLTAGEINVQDLLLSGQFKTAGFDEGQGVLIDQGGVVAKGTDADGNESLAILGSDGALTAVGANLVGGSLTINSEDGDATHFEEGFESGVIPATFKQPDRWLEVIESGFSAPEVNSTAHTGTKSLTMSHKRTVGNSLGSGSYIRNESKIQIDLTGLNSSLSSYLLSFWLYIPNYKTYGDLRSVESKIQVLNWSQESGNFYYPSTSLSLSGSSLSDLGTGWVHVENVKLVAANTLRVVIKAELSLDNTSTPALPCYLDDVVIDGNFGQSSVRISSADGANIVWTDEVGAQIGKLGVNPSLGTIKMTTPRLDTSQDVGLGGKLYIGNRSGMLFASPSQVDKLPDGEDLDYRTELGWFVTTENPVGITNSPVSGGFMLRVERLSPTTFIIPSSGFLQTLVTPDGVTYTRSLKSNTWSKWGMVATNSTDWKMVPSVVGTFAETLQVCKTGNLVSLRGQSPSRTWVAGWTRVGGIPAGYRPAAGHQVAVDVCENFGNIGCNAAIYPDDNNGLYVWTGGGTGTLVFGGSWIAEA